VVGTSTCMYMDSTAIRIPLITATMGSAVLTCHRVLLDAGADVLGTDSMGRTSLHKAAANGNATLIQRLLDAKGSLLTKDGYGDTPLHVAAREGHHEVLHTMLARLLDNARRIVLAPDFNLRVARVYHEIQSEHISGHSRQYFLFGWICDSLHRFIATLSPDEKREVVLPENWLKPLVLARHGFRSFSLPMVMVRKGADKHRVRTCV
jgi:hypothetical protein